MNPISKIYWREPGLSETTSPLEMKTQTSSNKLSLTLSRYSLRVTPEVMLPFSSCRSPGKLFICQEISGYCCCPFFVTRNSILSYLVRFAASESVLLAATTGGGLTTAVMQRLMTVELNRPIARRPGIGRKAS